MTPHQKRAVATASDRLEAIERNTARTAQHVRNISYCVLSWSVLLVLTGTYITVQSVRAYLAFNRGLERMSAALKAIPDHPYGKIEVTEPAEPIEPAWWKD